MKIIKAMTHSKRIDLLFTEVQSCVINKQQQIKILQMIPTHFKASSNNNKEMIRLFRIITMTFYNNCPQDVS